MSMLLNDHASEAAYLVAAERSIDRGTGERVNRIRALLVDDDADYREAATAALENLGFAVAGCADGGEMFSRLTGDGEFDVIVLDWNLETGPSIDLMPRLHDSGINLPVVVLSAVSSVNHEHAALDRGAVDFVDKARGIGILAKRLRLIVQSSRNQALPGSADPFALGKLVLHPDTNRAYWNSVDVDLTVTEFRIVAQLVTRAGEYVTYRSIYDCVHSRGFMAGYGENGFRTNVRSSIRRIRNKFRKLDDRFSEIENYPSFGYRWRAENSCTEGELANQMNGGDWPSP